MSSVSFELDLLPGLNSDDTTFAATGRWADGANVRFWNGKPQVIGGWIELHDTVTTGICRSLYAFRRAGVVQFVYGTASRLYVGAGIAVPSNRSPAGLGSSIANWSFSAYGDTLLASPQDGTLYEQSGASNATEVTQAPDRITCMRVTHERQVLAFGCNEEVSGTFNGLCIRGSDIEDYTDWTTSPTNNAFEHILEGSGSIVTACQIGAFVAVWTDSALYLGQYLGDPSQTYRFDKVADGSALIAPNALCVVDEAAYWLATDLKLRRWVPGGPVETVPCPIQKAFTDNFVMTQRSKIVVVNVAQFEEIWIFYSHAADGSTENSRYIALSTKTGTWFRGAGAAAATAIARTAAMDNGLVGSVLTAAGLDGQTVAIDSGGNFFAHENTNAANAEALNWFIQSADQYVESGRRRVMIRGVIPDFEDQVGDVSLTLFVRDRPQSPAVTKGPYTLTTAATKKDFRASGKLVSVKFSGGAASGSYMRLGKPLFDVVPMGER